jgi:hypothetical protein
MNNDNNCNNLIDLSDKIIEKIKCRCYPKSIDEIKSKNDCCIFYINKNEKRISYKSYKIPIKKVCYMLYHNYKYIDILSKKTKNLCDNLECVNPLHILLINNNNDNNKLTLQNESINNSNEEGDNQRIESNNKKRKRLNHDESDTLNHLIKKHKNKNNYNHEYLLNEKEIIEYCYKNNISKRTLKRHIKNYHIKFGD